MSGNIYEASVQMLSVTANGRAYLAHVLCLNDEIELLRKALTEITNLPGERQDEGSMIAQCALDVDA